MLFNRAKSDFPCPEFNGELSFWVVFTLFKKCKKSLILQLQKKRVSKDIFLRGKFQCPQKHLVLSVCKRYEKWLWSSLLWSSTCSRHIFFLFWNSYPLLKVNPTPSCRLELWPSLLDIFHRCCLSMQLFSFCKFFDIKRDPWLGMVMSPFNSVWQVDNSCPSQHFSHFCYWGGGDLKSQTELQSYICQKTNFQWAAVGAENTLHYIQDMDSKNIEE